MELPVVAPHAALAAVSELNHREYGTRARAHG